MKDLLPLVFGGISRRTPFISIEINEDVKLHVGGRFGVRPGSPISRRIAAYRRRLGYIRNSPETGEEWGYAASASWVAKLPIADQSSLSPP